MISTEIADDPLELEMGFLANDPARCLVINGFHQIFGDRTQTRLREGNRSTRRHYWIQSRRLDPEISSGSRLEDDFLRAAVLLLVSEISRFSQSFSKWCVQFSADSLTLFLISVLSFPVVWEGTLVTATSNSSITSMVFEQNYRMERQQSYINIMIMFF